MRRRRIIKTLVVFLLVGAIVNVAVAWECAMWAPAYARWSKPSSIPGRYAEELFTRYWPDLERSKRIVSYQSRSWSATISVCGTLSSYPPVNGGSIILDADSISEICVGTPFRAMFHVARMNMRNGAISSYPITYAIRSPQGLWWLGVNGGQDLPLGFLWPGFAINTMFYAAVLWGLFAVPGFVRRRIRARRGQCPACAYPIGTNPLCTECGKPVPKRLGATEDTASA